MSYTNKRYLTFFAITVFVLVLPFITVGGNHMLLLSFERLEFHFLGAVFNVTELTVMPFLLMFFFIGILAVTAIFGRAWCGWACPQTIFRTIYRDYIEGTLLGLRRRDNKQKSSKNYFAFAVAFGLWGILSLIISANFLWYFVPPKEFFLSIQNPYEHSVLFIFLLSIAAFIFYNIVIFKENFCVYVCPYARIQTSLFDSNTKQIIYDYNRGGEVFKEGKKVAFKRGDLKEEDECTACEACVKVCPAHIDIRKGSQFECISCLECVDSCEKVMGKLGKKSLIEWGSVNSVIRKEKHSLFSKKNISFLAALILSLILGLWMALDREAVLINVNRDTQLYKIDEGKVTNNYLFTVQNREPKEYTFFMEIKDPRFTLKRVKPFKIKGGERVKKVVSIETVKDLKISSSTDTVLKVKVKVYAKEQKEIASSYDLSFIYPGRDLLKN